MIGELQLYIPLPHREVTHTHGLFFENKIRFIFERNKESMKHILIIFLIILTQYTFGQKGSILERTLEEQVAQSMEDYISRINAKILTTQENEFQRFGLLDIKEIDADFVLRYCTYDSVVEIIKKEDTIQGTVIFVLEGYENNTTKKVFLKKEILSSQDCERLIENIVLNDLKTPTVEKHSKKWKRSYFGFTGTLEIISTKVHFSNVYRKSRNRLNEYTGVFSDFINSIENLPTYVNLKKRFYRENPYNRYLYWNGYGVHISY